ncbi:MAG: hypothetical protein M3Z08_14500 [Chloroflexota bacterium]|nr:hypothetical protein [Chloroflexota bacterium]
MSLKPMLLDLLDFTQITQHTLIAELDDAERTTSGTPIHWSARDHVAHLTFWKRHLVCQLHALLIARRFENMSDAHERLQELVGPDKAMELVTETIWQPTERKDGPIR